ncbi:MAG: ABC transporter permease [Bacteroides sp.]|nr:ABC transporter permease [Eubacterium sp.]MCM1417778.1 ABC transporter permease [Roseburia sp.]MCM1461331.1 ABC transporter permease [Bacteroides sp.]
MRRILLFSGRNIKEILRDPLSYLFCLGFPIVMLIVMAVVNESIPPEAGMHIFEVEMLTPAVAVFGLMFTMLFAALQVSKDRGGSFLIRLYASPMRAADFIAGYFLPCLLIAAIQLLLCMLCGLVIGAVNGTALDFGNLLLSALIILLPAALFIGFGILFGSLFSDKAAPGLCSIIISVGTMLGGVFMDVDALGGVIYQICAVLPFYHSVKMGRAALAGDFGAVAEALPIVLIYAAAVLFLAAFAFGRKMKADLC